MKLFLVTCVDHHQQQALNQGRVRRRLYSCAYLRAPAILRKIEAANQVERALLVDAVAAKFPAEDVEEREGARQFGHRRGRRAAFRSSVAASFAAPPEQRPVAR